MPKNPQWFYIRYSETNDCVEVVSPLWYSEEEAVEHSPGFSDATLCQTVK